MTTAVVCFAVFVALIPVTVSANEQQIEQKPEPRQPKNVIFMLADGAGHSTLEATRFWLGRSLMIDDEAFESIAVATYAQRRGREPRDMHGNSIGPLEQDPHLVYCPTCAWSTGSIEGNSAIHGNYPAGFTSYEWHRRTHPDSANTMTTLMTGVQTYTGAITVDGAEAPVKFLAEAMHEAGKRTGIVMDVVLCDATPAADRGAHNVSRGNSHEITLEMFGAVVLDVIGGGGNVVGLAAGVGERTGLVPDDRGGAVNKAMHGNEFGRLIEEYVMFDEAVAAVAAHRDDDSNDVNFDNTLLVVTADHDHLLFDPDADTVPYQPLVNNGPGQLPGYRWLFSSHSHRSVPLFARGAGARDRIALATKNDRYTDEAGREFGHGLYTTQAEVGTYLKLLANE